MKIALVLYDRLSYFEFFSFYNACLKAKNLDEDLILRVCSLKEEIKDENSLFIKPDTIGDSLDGYDLVFIPGGKGAKTLIYDDIFLSWLKSAKLASLKVAFGYGSLLFAYAGLTKEVKLCLPEELSELSCGKCSEIIDTDVVFDGDFISAFGDENLYKASLEVFEKLDNLKNS